MPLVEEKLTSAITINDYDNNSITINNTKYTKAIFIYKDRVYNLSDIIKEDIKVNNLKSSHIQKIFKLIEDNEKIALRPDVIIVSTGNTLELNQPLALELEQSKSVLEFMSKQAALSTYTLLLSEQRDVALLSLQ